ncbi:ABC transporter permease [Arthrobacter sp. NPDC093128]|uniref:ABC transporter permease n=1 Tax=Arthrobacter sp. NPDC093128 TaxID=3154979 RepID=UPI0034270182
MLRFAAKRVLGSILVLLVLTALVFILSRLVPNDPAVIYAGPKAPPEELERIRAELGFNRPLWEQYFVYLKDLFMGNWGTSLATKRPVLDELLSRLPSTLELLMAAMVVAFVGGITLGVWATKKPGRIVDGLVRFLAIGGISMPAFWLGLLLQLVFVGGLGILPATGQFSRDLEYTSPTTAVTGFPLLDSLLTGNFVALNDGLLHLILPTLTLAAYPLGLIARMTRSSMLEVLNQDYIFTAKAYDLRQRSIHWRLALRNALPPVLTVGGMAAAYTLTATFFVELVFNWPGIGQFASSSMLAVDYPAIMAITLLGAVGYLIANLAVDILQANIDPRVALS